MVARVLVIPWQCLVPSASKRPVYVTYHRFTFLSLLQVETSLREFILAGPFYIPKKIKLRMLVQKIIASGWFSAVIVAFIIANTAVLSLDQHPMDEDLQFNLEVANFVLTLVFVLEAALKLYGMGLRGYASDSFNLFDAAIVAVSIVELGLTPPAFLVGSSDAAESGE